MKKRTEVPVNLSRRNAIEVLLGASATLVIACGKSALGTASSEADAAANAGGDAGATASGACAESPEGEIGPYFSDDSDAAFDRSNIFSNLDGSETQVGIPLSLTITVVDVQNGCVPYANAQVDIWHCNASGVYSDQEAENTTTVQWLRGFQLTDDNGQVTFKTVIPGWYQGRTTHIHLRVRSSYNSASSTSDGSNTTQLFFDQSFIDSLATSVAPYNAQGKNSTTNANDHVFTGETKGANVLSLAGDNDVGYAASVTIGIPIAS